MPESLPDAILAIWREVLQQPAMGATDDLFDLGGDSVVMTRMAARMRDRLGIDVPLDAFFEAPTVESMAELVSKPAG